MAISTPEIIVVSGLPRSGTSLVMQMLAAGGLEVVADGHRPADHHNPRGYFEDGRVLHLDRDTSWLPDARGKALKVVATSLHLLPSSQRYRVLLLKRPLEEVLTSQRKMLGPGQRPTVEEDNHARLWFENFLFRAEQALREAPHCEILALQYHDLLRNPRREAERIAAFVGHDLDLTAMAAAVDPALHRNRSGIEP